MTVKKIISYLLIVLILFFTIIALLGIWDIIPLEDVVGKLLSSLLVVFAASAVVLFIFSVLVKDPQESSGKTTKPEE
jgi:polyferredoxin